MNLTPSQVKLLEDLGFHNYDNKKTSWYKETKKWSIQIDNGVVNVAHADISWGRWYGAFVDEKKYPPWVKKTIAKLKEGGIE